MVIRMRLLIGLLICTLSTAQAEELTLAVFEEHTKQDTYANRYEDFVETAFNELGVTIKWVKLPAKRAIQEVKYGLIDGIPFSADNISYNAFELIKVAEPSIRLPFWIHMNAARSCDELNTIEKLTPVNVLGFQYFEQGYAHLPIKAMTVARFELLPKVLANRRADFTLLPHNIFTDLDPSLQLMLCNNYPPYIIEFHTYLNPKHKDLATKLSQVYAKLRSNTISKASP